MQQQTALVTGGCGFVGRHLVKALLADGYAVWMIDNLSTGQAPAGWVPTEHATAVTFIAEDVISFFSDQLNVRKKPAKRELPAFTEIFHLASVVGGRALIEGDPMAVAIDLAIDALFFRWVVSRHEEAPPRIVYASSSAAYPVDVQNKPTALALSEAMISFDGQLGMPDMTYGWSKLTGEYLSRIVAQRYGVPVACVRPFSGYGGDQDTSYPVPAIARRVALRENPLVVWGTGEQGRDFIHIDDCITAMRLALKRISDGRAVNIGTGKLTTMNQVATLFSQLAGYAPNIKPLVNKPVGVQSRYSNPAYMQELLEWSPTITLAEGFARVLEEQEEVVAREKTPV